MKHIKKFNESLDNVDIAKQELQEFCNDYLANLIDEGYFIRIIEINRGDKFNKFIIRIGKYDVISDVHNTHNFHWFDIQDYILPFITILSETYSVKIFQLSNFFTHVEKLIDINELDSLSNETWHTLSLTVTKIK